MADPLLLLLESNSKRLKCACVEFDGLDKLRNDHQTLEAAIQRLATSAAPGVKEVAAAQKAMGKVIAGQIALHNRHKEREHGIARVGCELTKMYAIDAPPDAPPLRRVPYDVNTKPAAHVLKSVKASAKRKRAAAGRQKSTAAPPGGAAVDEGDAEVGEVEPAEEELIGDD